MALILDSVYAGYDNRAVLLDIGVEVRSGECLGVFGHNGAGKTTMLRVLAGTVRPMSGQVRASSDDGMPSGPVVTLVPQEEMVFEHLSVHENLRIALWNDRAAGRTADDRIADVCGFLPALGPLMQRRAGALSGGERRQVALARALLADPDVLLVDEPCLGLSPVAVDLVMEKLLELHDAGKTIVIVEQNLPVALEVVGRYYVVRQGRVVDEADASARSGAPLDRLYELI